MLFFETTLRFILSPGAVCLATRGHWAECSCLLDTLFHKIDFVDLILVLLLQSFTSIHLAARASAESDVR